MCLCLLQGIADNEGVDLYNDSESELSCMTCHEGFPPVWLNVWVVQAAHFEYRQHYETGDTWSIPIHEYVSENTIDTHLKKYVYCNKFIVIIDNIGSLHIAS